MAIVNTHYGFCAKGGAAVKFTYTGEYNVRDDGVVELLTSGTLVFLNPAVIDIFCVGGGSAGCDFSRTETITELGLGGGSGGHTATLKKFSANGAYEISIGEGGAVSRQAESPSPDGGNTVFGTILTAMGGTGKTYSVSTAGRKKGCDGGSGGGGGVTSNSDYGAGGSDGQNGEHGFPISSTTGGSGQGTTTREFGEEEGKLYAGAGGGGRYMISTEAIISIGGSGGGGAGGWAGKNSHQNAGAGGANTGGGGGGAARYTTSNAASAGPGGSGIVCFRGAK